MGIVDSQTVYFALAALLLLSIATISLCKAERSPIETYSEFLFSGKTFFHSLVSSAGAIFSVTYLLGATFIYSTVYRAWTFVMAVVGIILAFVVIRRVIKTALRELEAEVALGRRENLLLAFMRLRLPERNFRVFRNLLTLAFFLLLVEEVVVSRLILRTILPGAEPVADGFLFVIICVVLAYLYTGGFRAVLTSDLIQALVLAVFLTMLGISVASRSDTLPDLVIPPITALSHLASAVLLWTVYGVCFLVMAVDLFSRLNFRLHTGSPEDLLVRFSGLSLLLVFIIIAVGSAFGLAMAPDLGATSTSNYFESMVTLFVGSGAEQVRVMFLVALFCMIFTTIDTLLITTMQVRSYTRGFGSRRTDIPSVLLMAVAAAIVIPGEAAPAFGIYVGSILILPASQLLQELYPQAKFSFASDHRFLWAALGGATLLCLVMHEELIGDFSIQHVIPGLFLTCALASNLVALIARKRETNG